jgi:hypothetical protein
MQARLDAVNRNLARTFQQQDHLDVNIHKGAAYRELMERRKQVERAHAACSDSRGSPWRARCPT